MNKKLKKIFVGFAVIVALAGMGGTYAYFSDSITVTNHISTGDVNIDLSEYEVINGKEIAYENPKLVVPGDTISKIPRVTNLAEPCWVRVRISYENARVDLEGFSDDNIVGISDEWIKQGEYYYLKKILDTHKTVDIFEKVVVPAEWTEVHSGQYLAINIQADAIQAANFQPDFNAMSPWGNEEIELCVHEENGVMVSRKKNVKLQVEFNGEAHKLIAVPDDFFTNFQTAMPGDVFSDSVTVSNTTSNEAEVFFRTGLENQNNEQLDLLNHMELKISMDGKELYSGDLIAQEIDSNISLGIFKPGEKGQLDFSVTVPSELKNVYALRDADVKWIFTVNENELEKSETQGTAPVKTGDSSPIMALIMLSIISCGVVVIILIRKRRKRI